MWTANAQMMYYHIERHILDSQKSEGWGAKIVDKPSEDLKRAFPEMLGFSPRNLKYMRRFAETRSDEQIVQRSVARLSWRHNNDRNHNNRNFRKRAWGITGRSFAIVKW